MDGLRVVEEATDASASPSEASPLAELEDEFRDISCGTGRNEEDSSVRLLIFCRDRILRAMRLSEKGRFVGGANGLL